MQLAMQTVFFYKYMYWLFQKLQKTEGKVFIALWTSQGDFETPGESISPKSPLSLKPGILQNILS